MGIEFIKHSAKGTTWSKKNHKYVSKTVKNGKTYYKYNSKTKKYDKYDLQKGDTIPQTPEEEAKFYMNQLVGGLESAQRKLLSSKGIIADDSAYNHMLITDKNFAAKQNTKARRAKHSDEDEAYLEHHGIQGQKWGERNGPPYPLDANKATQAKKKAAAADKPYAKKDYNKTSSGSSGSGDSVKTHGTNKSYGGSQKLTFKERRAQALERKAAKAEERAAYQKRLSDARQRAVKAREAERSAKQKAADAERKEKEKLLAEKKKAKEAKEKEKAAKLAEKQKAQEAKNQKPEVKEQPKNTVVQTRIQQPQQNQNNQQSTQQMPQNVDSRKQQILDSKNPMLLYQNKDMFTDQEFSAALNRLRNEQQLRDMVNKPVPSKTKRFIDKYTTTAKTVKEVYDATKNAAEVVRDVTTIFGMKDSGINKVTSAIAGTKSLFDDGKSNDKGAKDKGVKDKANQQTKQSEQQFKQTVENAAKDFNQKASEYRSNRNDIFDVEYTEVVPRETLSLPLNQFLLEDKRARHDGMDEDPNYLEHHGIQGQKWGERNGPPYPLDSDSGKQAQKKAAAADNPSSKKDYNKSEHHFVKKSSHGSEDKFSDKPTKMTKEEKEKKKWDHSIDDEERNRTQAYQDRSKWALIQGTAWGAAALTTFLSGPLVGAATTAISFGAGFGLGFAMKSGEIIKGENAIKREKADLKYREKHETKDEKTGLYLKNPPEVSLKDDIKKVNPGFENFSQNTKNNCMLCSVALDLRLKGYDVMAGKAATGYNPNSFSEWYKGAKLVQNEIIKNSEYRMMHQEGPLTKKETQKMYDETVAHLASTKNSNGALEVDWVGGRGSGHSMQYVVRDGQVHFIDAQIGKEYSEKEIKDVFSNSTGKVYEARLDDKEFNYKKFSKYLVR